VRSADFVKSATRRNRSGGFRRDRTARLRLFAAGQFLAEQLGEVLGGDGSTVLNVNHVWRQAAELIPGDDIDGRARDDFRRVEARQRAARGVTEADTFAVANETHFGRKPVANGGQRFIAASGRDAFGLVKKNFLQISASA